MSKVVALVTTVGIILAGCGSDKLTHPSSLPATANTTSQNQTQPSYAANNPKTGGGLNPNVAPGGNFDLSKWELQLPTGTEHTVTTISSSQLQGPGGYQDPYFYTDKTDGAMTFMDPKTGVTTSGSLHPRSELREMTNGWLPAARTPYPQQKKSLRCPTMFASARFSKLLPHQASRCLN